MTLKEYRAKRDFSRSPEPEGATAGVDQPAVNRRFVVQRHRARRLHYDLRLEVDGVLVSWAVPKGPTLDPSARLLAVQVEDHPIEYVDFEGVIPNDEYGAGDVIVWDRGMWQPSGTDEATKAIAAGELHFDLFGEKLSGRFVLIRRDKGGSAKPQWLLLHKRDESARAGWDPEEHPRSVKSGRTNDEVARAPRARWRSGSDPRNAEEAVSGPSGPSDSGASRRELSDLDALPSEGEWSIDGRTMRLTNLDKVLFPGIGGGAPLTKRDLIRYYVTIAPSLLPHLDARPLNLLRYPNGVNKKGFWQKAVPSHAPEWLARWRYTEADPGETEWYVVADCTAALAWLANHGAVELNPWTSNIPRVHEPTYALIDIDPGTNTSFDDVLVLARLFRAALEHLGVAGFPKVSGKRGVQIFVPVASGYTFAATSKWVETLSRAVGASVPELVSWKWQKRDRGGLARLDYTQNAINKTLVAPYSVRATPRAAVSAPITWDEIDDPLLSPDRWTINTIGERVARTGDLFRGALDRDQRLPALS